ncbi:MAG: protein kinase domain-containing protein [Isosphaeraceae bacterium]
MLEKIACGGMGIVYKARQKKPNRIVALKTILAGTLASPELVERFYLEAEAAAQLEHPGIVPIYEVGEFAGQHFFSMGFVEGGSLAEQVKDGPLSTRRAASLIMQVAEAVGYANGRGIIHRDLKPGNVLLDKDGKPRVTDFGVAKNVTSDSHLTMDGQIVGTASYMPPEQAKGKIDEIGPASDVYSLGATLYCLLTGRPPFQAASTIETINQVRHQEPVSPRQLNGAVNRDLETICLKCLQKDPAKRYPVAHALADDLRRFLNGEPIRARRVTPHERLWRWCRRNPLVASLTVGIALSLCAGTIVSWIFAVRARHDAQAARTQETLARRAQRLSDRRWYVAEMNLAFQDWKEGHLDLVQERLSRHGAPSAGQKDPRGFEWYYLDHLCNLDLATLRGHRGLVKCLAFSADGTKIASGSSSDGQPNEVILWDVAGAREIRRFEAPGGPLQRLMFSSDGKRLALAAGEPGRPGEIQIWDVTRVYLDHTLPAEPSTVFCHALHPDGQTLASAAGGGAIKIWNTSTGLTDRVLEGHKSEVLALAFVAAGETLASVSLDQTVRLCETTTGRQTSLAQISFGSLKAAALSPDGKALAGCGDDARVRIWNVHTGQETASFSGAIDQIDRLAYSHDGRRLAASGDGELAQVWQIENRATVVLRGHAQTVFDLAFSPDGWRIATASGDGTVKIWNAIEPEETRILSHDRTIAEAVACSPDGREIASANFDGPLRTWDRATGREKAIMNGHSGVVSDLSYSPRGDKLVSAGYSDGTVRVWDARTGDSLLVLRGHTSPVTRASFSPDGREIVSSAIATSREANARGDGIKIWNASTGQERLTLPREPGAVAPWGFRGTCYSPDGKWIVASPGDNAIHAWEAATGKAAWILPGHKDIVSTIAISANGHLLASAGRDQTVKLWDIETGQEIRTLRGHSANIHSVVFSPDQKRLASVSGGQYRSGTFLPSEVKIWDTETGQEILTLRGRGSYASDVAFSPDGHAIASANADGTVTVWDAQPLSDDDRRARQASMFVRFLFDQGITADQVQDRIRHDPTIDEALRPQAANCADDLQRITVRHSAEKAVHELFSKGMFKPQVIEHLRQVKSLPDSVRREAIDLAERSVESAKGLEKSSFAVVRTPASQTAAYRLALKQAETACHLSPFEVRYQTTLSLAQYRTGNYEAALATLAHAEAIDSRYCASSVPDLAVHAMTQFRLGQFDNARTTFTRLREVMKRSQRTGDLDAHAFFHEAESLLRPAPAT